ncbi:MAG: hypothetical protein HY287_11390 [Planctomycetes bacterium]|nr:hypothetical protein [Planctomycetota bacterium]MBI3834923.1 hypothetical protein [Planctomycetota bacterium]
MCVDRIAFVVAGWLVAIASVAMAQDCGGAFQPDDGVPADDTEGRMPLTCFQPNGPGAGVCTDDGCILDVLVVYTHAALSTLGSQQALSDWV